MTRSLTFSIRKRIVIKNLSYMKPEIKSVTVYVRESHFELFLKGEYDKVVWTLTSGDPDGTGYFAHKQVKVQISADTYQNMVDAEAQDDRQMELPF